MSASSILKIYSSLSRHLVRRRGPLFPCSTSLSLCRPAAATTASLSSYPSSSYLSVRIHCPKHVADPLSEALLCFGATSVSIDHHDVSPSSHQIQIESIFPVSQEVRLCISKAADSIGLKLLPYYQVEMCQEHDWVQKVQESFHPLEVTQGLWIVPEWTTPPVVEATNIILNPGLAFGTGEHPTTKLCLLLLKSLITGGELFLDYGTGSGVLAIAALKFGAATSVGIDIDPSAITSARHNAALNNIQPHQLHLHLVPSKTSSPSVGEDACGFGGDQSSCAGGMLFERGEFDVVIANILLNPLLELADHIVSYAKPRATVGISGILSEQLPYITDRYSQFLEDITISEMDDWACLSGKKKRKL